MNGGIRDFGRSGREALDSLVCDILYLQAFSRLHSALRVGFVGL